MHGWRAGCCGQLFDWFSTMCLPVKLYVCPPLSTSTCASALGLRVMAKFTVKSSICVLPPLLSFSFVTSSSRKVSSSLTLHGIAHASACCSRSTAPRAVPCSTHGSNTSKSRKARRGATEEDSAARMQPRTSIVSGCKGAANTKCIALLLQFDNVLAMELDQQLFFPRI